MERDAEMFEAYSYLREHGMRVTPQRELIIKILMKTKAHPTADVLFAEVKERYPALSLNTVYKTLELFEDKGMIKRFNVGMNIFRYDANTDPHAHIVCTKCNRVDDLPGMYDEFLSNLYKDEQGFSGYSFLSAELFVYGLCENCREGGELLDGIMEM